MYISISLYILGSMVKRVEAYLYDAAPQILARSTAEAKVVPGRWSFTETFEQNLREYKAVFRFPSLREDYRRMFWITVDNSKSPLIQLLPFIIENPQTTGLLRDVGGVVISMGEVSRLAVIASDNHIYTRYKRRKHLIDTCLRLIKIDPNDGQIVVVGKKPKHDFVLKNFYRGFPGLKLRGNGLTITGEGDLIRLKRLV